ncbi:MAG: CDP-alcohol phosphatidyltransferase family protein [Deltaproteobacteria bacterium]|nr:CDP-alcohol phosphatidyltransferase family protein [Deltaproteobacteria bacterium]
MSLANLITLMRLPLLLTLVALLFISSLTVQLSGLALLIVLFLLDWFDGYVARLRNEVTEMGAVLDVALDRAVENILWLTFMYLAMVPLWVPIVFLIRSFIVDGIRGVALTRGKSGFGMMHSPVGRFLVASRFMRAFYGLVKALTFCFLYLTHALAMRYPTAPLALHSLNQGLILLSVALCVVRGIPVLLDGRIYFGAAKT